MNGYALKALTSALNDEYKNIFDQSGLKIEHGELCARGLFLLYQAHFVSPDIRTQFFNVLKEKCIGLHEDAAFEAFAECAGVPVDEIGGYYLNVWRTSAWKADVKALGGVLPVEAFAKDLSEKGKVLSSKGHKAAEQGAAFAQKTARQFLKFSKTKRARVSAVVVAGLSVIVIGGVVAWPIISDKMAATVLSVEEGSKPLTMAQRVALEDGSLKIQNIQSWQDIARLYLSWEGVRGAHVEALSKGVACGRKSNADQSRSQLEALVPEDGTFLPRDTLIALPVNIRTLHSEEEWSMKMDNDQDPIASVQGNVYCDTIDGTTVVAQTFNFSFAKGTSKDWLEESPIIPDGLVKSIGSSTVDSYINGRLLARVEANVGEDKKGLTRRITLIPVALMAVANYRRDKYVLWSGRLAQPKVIEVSASSETGVDEDATATSMTAKQDDQNQAGQMDSSVPTASMPIPAPMAHPPAAPVVEPQQYASREAASAQNPTSDSPPQAASTSPSYSVSPLPEQIMYLTGGGVIRNGPGTDWDKVISLPMGTSVRVRGESDALYNGRRWYQVVGDFGEGFVWSGIVGRSPPFIPEVQTQQVPRPQDKTSAVTVDKNGSRQPEPSSGMTPDDAAKNLQKDLDTVTKALGGLFGN